jgi:hypothetical protein
VRRELKRCFSRCPACPYFRYYTEGSGQPHAPNALAQIHIEKKLNRLNMSERSGKLNLQCLHPVARVISYDMGFNPSTQL